jgi:S1-C subfamily serine protease
MRYTLSERFNALSGALPSASAGRRSPLPFPRVAKAALILCAALVCASPSAAPTETDTKTTIAEILGGVVTIQVQVVNHARSASTNGRERHGTGVVVDPGGLILTSALLVQEADSIVVTTFDARTMAAAVAALDPALGIAVLRPAAPLGVRPLAIGRSAALDLGSAVSIASAAPGRAVAVARVLEKGDFATEHEFLVEDALFTAPLVPECAGAALVDGTGKLIGVGVLAVKQIPGADAPAAAGNVFIPVERFQPALAHLARADGSRPPRRPWLGLVTEASAGGLVVTHVPPASPADRAGLRVGDLILAVDGTEVRTHAALYRSVWRAGGPGTAVRLTIHRNGATRDIRVQSIEAQDYLIHRA